MANDGQKEKVGDDTPTESGKHIDFDVEEDNCNEETRDTNHEGKDVGQKGGVPKKSDWSGYYNEDDLQVWKNRCLRRDYEMKGMANKLADLQTIVNFMIQNNVIQHHSRCKIRRFQRPRKMNRKGDRKQFLRSLSTPGPRNTLTQSKPFNV
ncbi:hypothetical protein ACSBR2_001483 [Camellia fascicularis]